MILMLLSFNLLRRDWRAGEWRVLMLALVLAVGSLSTVGLFADRVRQALGQQASALLGADMRITSTRPISSSYRLMAKARDLTTVESRTFPSMVSYKDQVLLCEMQSVEAGYPLRGKIEIDPPSRVVSGSIPMRGTVWADERLMRRLDLSVGQSIGIGARHFIVAARITRDIDQSFGFASFAPRVLMNADDVASTGLLQEGSRISYRLMFAGDAKQLVALRSALHLTANEKLEDVTDARPEIRTALERAEHFLGLAALTAAILAGVAILLAARHYVSHHLDSCAVMRCLGAEQNQVLRLFLYQFMLAGLVAVTVGLLLGYATQAILVKLVLFDSSLPQPGILPALKAAVSGFALLIGFAFLPLMQLRRVSPLRVIRRELGAPQASGWLIYGLAVLVLASLFLWQADSLKLGLSVLLGLLAGLMIFGVLAWSILHALARYASFFDVHWKHAFNNLARHGRSVAVQVTALSLGGMALLVLTLVKGDLLQSWQGKLPVDTPNRFVVNIQPDQQAALQDFFVREALPVPQMLPMVKGRLVAINEHAVSGENYPEARARSLVEREFNLSYAADMPGWNTLVGGKWWSATDRGQLSVEEGIAKTLGIHLGDTLVYDVAGSRLAATVTSLRRVQWDSMKVNFFVIATPQLLADAPQSLMTSFYLPPDKVRSGDQLVRVFPNLLVINTDDVIAQVRSIIGQVSKTVSVVFLFTLSSGFVVLYAALLATRDERVHEAAILRTLGADSAYLRRLHLSEFAVIGLLAGLFASTGSALLGWVLARYVLDIPYSQNGLVWLVGVPGCAALVVLTGWLNTRRLGKITTLRILRGE
jgi:putative ABC transport system permease protein